MLAMMEVGRKPSCFLYCKYISLGRECRQNKIDWRRMAGCGGSGDEG